MNHQERTQHHQWRQFTRDRHNKPLADVMAKLPIGQRIAILNAIGKVDENRRKSRAKFAGITAKNNRNYKGVSIPLPDGTRFMLPERPFRAIRKALTRKY